MRIVIVEDQCLYREFLAGLIHSTNGLELAGIAEDGDSAKTVIRQARPDVVILDILIPRQSGIRIARWIRETLPATRVLAISAESDHKTLFQIHRMRLAGFIDKNIASVATLLEAIEAIRQNRRYVSPTLERAIRALRADPLAFQKILTPREQEVLSLIGAGLTDAAIAGRLGLIAASVQTHRRNLCRKLGVHSTPELIRYAIEHGFWKPEFPAMGLEDTYHEHV